MQDYPRVEGRTFRASEPLDPSNPRSLGPSALQNVFGDFETVNNIFDPVVEEGEARESETGTERQIEKQYNDTLKSKFDSAEEKNDISKDGDNSNIKDIQNDGDVEYAAQRPYPQTSSTEEEYYRSRSYPSGTQYRETVEPGRQVTRRRMTVTGSGDGGETHTTYETYETVGGSQSSGGSQPSDTSRTYTYQRQPTRSRTYTYQTQGQPSQSNTYSSQGQAADRSRYYSRGEVRGQRYDGPRYVDNMGHYIDAQGRHLDSTGRYYDISGRYSDARVTHTGTYQTDSSGSQSGTRYYDVGESPSRYSSGGDYVPTSDGRTSNTYSGGTQVSNTYSGSSGRNYDQDQQGQQFYSGGSSYRTTYDPITSQISSDPVCILQ